MKKLLLLTFVFVFAVNSIGFAAIGGSKVRMSAPRPATRQAAPPPASNYKPSAPAKSYNESAPAAKTATPQTAQQPSGGFMRNFGMFGGGMLLGGLLGSMFGFGNTGFFANLMGMLVNVLFLAAIFMAGRYLWTKLRSRDQRHDRR